MQTESTAGSKQENALLSLVINFLIPFLILKKGSQWLELSSAITLIIALCFPIGYFLYDFYDRRKYNFFSILGFISLLLTGGIGLLHLPKEWIAIKEAAIPAIIGIAVMISAQTKRPLLDLFLYNDQIIDKPKVQSKLESHQNEHLFQKEIRLSTYLLAFSFLLSAVLNYILAQVFIKSDTGTEAFNEELGTMMLWSYPVIVIPSMIVMGIALWRLIKSIQSLTGLTLDEILRQPQK